MIIEPSTETPNEVATDTQMGSGGEKEEDEVSHNAVFASITDIGEWSYESEEYFNSDEDAREENAQISDHSDDGNESVTDPDGFYALTKNNADASVHDRMLDDGNADDVVDQSRLESDDPSVAMAGKEEMNDDEEFPEKTHRLSDAEIAAMHLNDVGDTFPRSGKKKKRSIDMSDDIARQHPSNATS